jgi:glucose-6-phosphate 1-epimerase
VLQIRDDRYGELDVFLHGATVTHWAPPGADGVLWLSGTSTFSTQTAIRGGVPICYPWFANGPGNDLTPAHGYARLLDWTLESVQERPDGVEIVLGLPDGSGTVTWPGPAGTGSLSASYRVLLGTSLNLTLDVRNDGGQPATFEAALHTYFAVSDVHAVFIEGLAGEEYVDRQGGPDRVRQAEDVIRFAGETDRMYLGSTADVVIDDPGFRRRIAVGKTGSSSTVVWNPGAERAASMADLDPWTGFVCVETANIRADAITLAPGESHAMTAVLDVLPRG